MNAATYWNRGVDNVPMMTGAASVMDCSDLRDALDNLGVTILDRVLDVGCGTGRLSTLCNEYTGVDVAADAVTYCQRLGLNVNVIDGPFDLRGCYDTVCCMSVFTHIGRIERQQYLRKFSVIAHELVVDIIPGGEMGDVSLWRADVELFERDLDENNYDIMDVYSRTSPDGVTHRYYRAVQR